MKKKIKVIILTILLMIMMLIPVISNAEITETEKEKITQFLSANPTLSYYNYSKVEDICMTDEILNNVKGSQQVGPLKENVLNTREKINEYLEETIGITVDKLKNYQQFLEASTTENKDIFYFNIITGPVNYTDFQISEIEEIDTETIKFKLTAKADEEVFSNIIELVRKQDSYNFKSSTSVDGKQRPFTNEYSGKFNETEEKMKILRFINNDENTWFSFYNYTKPTEIPLLRASGTIPAKIGYKYGEIAASPKNGFKSQKYTLEDANKFMQEKAGINFNELNDFKEYVKDSSLDNGKTFYEVTENYSTDQPIFRIKSIKKLANGNIEVEVYEESYYENINNIVTLKPNGDSFQFVSSVKKNVELNSNSNNNSNNSNINQTSKTSTTTQNNKTDTSTAKNNIPKTGESDKYIIIITIISVLVIFTIMFVRYKKKYNF